MADTQLIALDWGTTSLRAYRFDRAGQVVESRQLASGIMRIGADGGATADFERAFDQACGDWQRAAPASAIVACGMIGSAQGWCEAAYLEIPICVDDLGGSLTEVATSSGAVIRIIPGLIARGPLPEVMRGEETQVAGALQRAADATSPGAPDAPDTETWFGLPGTHSKWVRVRDRRIVQFHTFMTGEVFAALSAHTLLGRTMRPPPTPDHHAFDRGVAVARSPEARAGVLSTMFSTRTLGLVGALAAEQQADYLSGLLIGHEIAAVEQLAGWLERRSREDRDDQRQRVALIGGDDLCRRYRRALVGLGHPPPAIASGATERGLWRVACAAGLVPRGEAC